MHHNSTIWLLLLITVLYSCTEDTQNALDSNVELRRPLTTKMVKASDLHQLYESDYSIQDSLAFDFNGDQHTDYILLLKHQQEKSFENEGTGFSKVLLIVASYPSGKLAQIERNHRVVFPFGYHQKDKDSYLSMHQQGRFFQVVHSWTKNKRIKRTLSFEYNQTNRSWYLHKDQTTYNSIDFSENPTIVQKTTAGTAFHSFDIFQE